jgi:hypothetical protein
MARIKRPKTRIPKIRDRTKMKKWGQDLTGNL